jgi:glycosyltransferase involved in cell wall biosynthesis
MATAGRSAEVSADSGGALRIVAYLTHAWPKQRGGSEVAIHGILRWLAAQGHQVRGIVKNTRGIETDGVFYQRKSAADRREWIQWADVVITQHGATADALVLCEQYKKPLYVYAHNYLCPTYYSDLSPKHHRMIWNSKFASEQNPAWTDSSVIVRPPVWYADWAGTGGDRITQINLSKLKGAEIFYSLVEELEGHRFLGVTGGWDNQIDARRREWTHANAYTKLAAVAPPNLQILPTQQDPRTIYRQTRILIVPTGNFMRTPLTGESYGLVAVEALAHGIPVIATKSPGMEEALDGAGVLIDDHEDLDAWREAILDLDDPKRYAEASEAARTRAQRLDPEPELRSLQEHLVKEIAVWKHRGRPSSSPTDHKITTIESLTVNESEPTSDKLSPMSPSSSPTTDELRSPEPARSTKGSKKRKPTSSSSVTPTSSVHPSSSAELSSSPPADTPDSSSRSLSTAT